jgi:dipeptidyl-peptidase-4
MRNSISRLFVLIFFFLYTIFVFNASAQEKSKITVEWIYSEEGKSVARVPSFAWLDDGTALLYDSRQPRKERTIVKLNPEDGQQTPLVDAKKAMKSLKKLLGKKDLPKGLPWPESVNASGQHGLCMFKDDIFLLELSSSRFIRVTNTEAEEKSARFSPDGKKLAFIRDNNLFIFDMKAKVEKQLTDDGSKTLLNGTLSWVYWEEVFARKDIGYWWSEDSEAIAFFQTDESPVSVMHYVDFKPYVPRLLKQRYPKAGTDNPIVRVGVIEVEKGETTWVDLEEMPHEYIVRVKWLPDNKRLSVQTMNRAQNELNLFFVDRCTGKSSPILKEKDKGWVNIHDDLYFLKNGKHFIWASERDSFAHLYRYTMEGKLVNQITKGEWAIRSSGGGPYWLRQAVSAIDEEEGWIYFTSHEKSSIERHLYRIKFDGTGMERLTKEDGFHSITSSPDVKYYFDRYSNISTLPSLALYKSDGQLVGVIAEPRPEQLEKFEVQYPELLTIPAKDGFPMPAQLLKPKDFDPSQEYPVILYVYGGPSAPTVANSWRGTVLFDQILLDKGYLVARVDNRSATAISKKLENIILKDGYGDKELNDLLDAVKWLKQQPYVDPERVGIWGWSGGGIFTLLAMTHSKEFKAGIAVAAVTDWRHYDTIWAEAYMKRPQDNPKGYEKTSLLKAAKNLSGRLLLVHGTYDDNVHPQNVWAFIDELIKAGKMFDLMIYPMRKHGISDDPAQIHLFNTMLEFWTKNFGVGPS